jgi:hypothetical protein
MLRSRWIHGAVLVALLATPLFLFSHRALAVQDSEDKVWFGPIGITPGQRALVNAIGNPEVIGNPNETPCNFVVRVFDRRGTLIQERPLQLAAGVIGSVELAVQDEENVIAVPLSRRTFRAETVGFNPQPDPPGKRAVTSRWSIASRDGPVFCSGGPTRCPRRRSSRRPGRTESG